MSMDHVVIKHLNKAVDVFFGYEGWAMNRWTRFAVLPSTHGVFLKQVKGVKCDPRVLSYVKEQLTGVQK